MNDALANFLDTLAGYYHQASDTYRAKTFERTASNIRTLTVPIISGEQAKSILKGIGDSTVQEIDEFLATGTSKRLQELEHKYQDRKAVIDLFTSIHGIGPKTASKFYDKGYRTLDDLSKKASLTKAQRVGLEIHNQINQRIPRDEMDKYDDLFHQIFDPRAIRFNLSGSYRRGEPDSGDIDLLIESRSDLNMAGVLVLLDSIITDDLSGKEYKYMGVVKLTPDSTSRRIDIQLIEPESYPFALLYFTGSQKFNILLRKRASELGYTLSEFGMSPSERTFNSEEEIFDFLGVKYLEPAERTRDISELPMKARR